MNFHIVGILNVTPDSFYDGGAYNSVDRAFQKAVTLIEQGATMLDVGGESSRPQAKAITAEEEIRRVVPVIEKIKKETHIPISIDTTKAHVARCAIEAGASIVNDISGFSLDENMPVIVSKTKVKVILNHMQGNPQTMQKDPYYTNVVSEISQFFEEKIELAKKHDISRERIILDLGIGFGKTLSHNLAILKSLKTFLKFNCPLMIGTSRKSFIAACHEDHGPQDRLGGSLSSASWAYLQGVTYFRVHDVYETKQALTVLSRIITANDVG